MTMLTDMVAHLQTKTAITTLVSARIYPDVLPQNPTLPALTFSQVSAVRVQNLQGPAGKSRHRIQIDCWASTYAGARALADAVRQNIDGNEGWWRDTFVGSVKLDNEFDLNEDAVGLVSVGLRRVVQEYIIAHWET